MQVKIFYEMHRRVFQALDYLFELIRNSKCIVAYAKCLIEVYTVFMNKATNKNKIKKLLKSRDKLRKRLEKIDAIFRQEKENEEVWPGHESNIFQLADSDSQVYFNQLALIEKELKRLDYKEEKR